MATAGVVQTETSTLQTLHVPKRETMKTTVTELENTGETTTNNPNGPLYRFHIKTAAGHDGFAMAKTNPPWYGVGSTVYVEQNGRKLRIHRPEFIEARSKAEPAQTKPTAKRNQLPPGDVLKMAQWAVGLAVDKSGPNTPQIAMYAKKLSGWAMEIYHAAQNEHETQNTHGNGQHTNNGQHE